MKLFVGIELPDNIKDYLYKLQSGLKNSKLAKVNWCFKKNFHQTLKFLGEVPEDKLDELKNKLRNIKYNEFKLKLTEIGFYPSEQRINVVWVGVEPENEIIELRKLVDAETMELGDMKSGVHITLGRVKFVRDKKKFKEKLKNVKVESLSFGVGSFALFSSTLSKDGPSYNVLERYGLV